MPLRNAQEGFALVSAVLLAGIIAALVAAFIMTVRINTKAAANAQAVAALKQAADGVTRLTALALAERLARPDAQAFSAAGVPYRCRLDSETTAEIAIQDQAGLIDLNAASPALLEAALSGIVADPAAAAAAILDFRDADDEPFRGGAEAEAYRLAAKPYGPKNGPFQSIAELDQVPGLEGEPAAALRSFVTVYAFHDGLDTAVAPARLTARLKGNTVIAPTHSPRQFFAIDAVVSSAAGGRFHRRAVIAVTREPDRPFQFVEWTSGGAEALGTSVGEVGSGCSPPAGQ